MRWHVPERALGVSRDVHIQKALRSLTTAEGEQFRLSPKTSRLGLTTCGSSGFLNALDAGGFAVGTGDTV